MYEGQVIAIVDGEDAERNQVGLLMAGITESAEDS